MEGGDSQLAAWPHLVNPVQPPNHGQGGEHPPRVAHIRQLLRTTCKWGQTTLTSSEYLPPLSLSTVESSRRQLPLTQPPAKLVCVDMVQSTSDGQCPHTAVHLQGSREDERVGGDRGAG